VDGGMFPAAVVPACFCFSVMPTFYNTKIEMSIINSEFFYFVRQKLKIRIK